MKPVKILIYEPYAFKVYGNTRYIISIFKYIDKKRFEPILVAPADDSFLDIIRNLGGRCVVMSPPDRLNKYGGSALKDGLMGKFLTAMSIIKYCGSLALFILKEKIDVIQCHSIRSYITVGLAAKLTRRPCFWYVKGDLENPFIDRIGYAMADRILFQCETTKNRKYPELVKKYNNKIRIIGNGIDLEEVDNVLQNNHSALQKELHIDKKNINILCTAQLCPRKGVDYLIKAMAKVRREAPNTVLYLLGDHCIESYKTYKTKLDAIVQSEQLENVVFLGWRSDALEVLSLMDIFVLPTIGEGVPKSIIEAMAMGKPVIATNVGGIPELVRHGETGFMLKPADSESLAEAIISLAKDNKLRNKFGAKAERIASKEYSIRDNIAGLEKLYQELIR
jgi:glycosyltransferase involved in cell wall biosynthesis